MRWWRKRNELDAEIEAHIRMAVAERVARGEDEAAARRAVEREMGNLPLVKDVAREAWGWVWLERLLQDVRYALRQLRKSPAFAATVISTLALGIAAPAAMFTVVDRVMLRPLPYRDAGRLVYINDGSRHNEHDWRRSMIGGAARRISIWRSGGDGAGVSRASGFLYRPTIAIFLKEKLPQKAWAFTRSVRICLMCWGQLRRWAEIFAMIPMLSQRTRMKRAW